MSDTEKGGLIATVIGPKRRRREYKARVRQLPENHREKGGYVTRERERLTDAIKRAEGARPR